MVRRTFVFVAVLTFALLVPAAFAGELEIHVINVGWGESILVRGPNGTTVLMDTGKHDQGTKIKDYLKTIGIPAATGLDYTITSHLDGDHVGGFDVVVGKGSGKYDVRVHNYYNGSTNCGTAQCKNWRTAAKSTTAKSPVVLQVGTQIALGDGATLTCIARNGNVIGGKKVAIPRADDENDRSIAALIQYGGFDYFWAGDMGGGKTDRQCTGRDTSQVDLESAVIKAILPGGAHPLITEGGIDVLQVSHHGSESSTNVNLLNGAAPALAIISAGRHQLNDQLPRKIVVDEVLAAKVACVKVPAPVVLQTEEGDPGGPDMSTSAPTVGDIVIHTDGKKTFTVEADGDVKIGHSQVADAHLPRTFPIDETKEP